ncbi:hypothetical protein GUITHDRAFT_86622 [Guillardia theta CCMP2712]|uniref:Uncharacterized protein n=1 Tax=Guillardia theta (strain CCMP2712) TaxID=905079 RepID=L1JDR6_GUITC|nr:hypothetical protein GUITHDRAFT_86622 [Guillardia theta CCMP2712]EKX46656.1 hypothetical protein GUITHDRAFT_86622 [Guillardia theta CCMP2712]|eukprot:XP_005833636.1 hypothetical protein GUITHDRAFT_86622 [Guillardia theta CCMP2712]
MAVAISPSGKLLASCSTDGTVVICSSTTGDVRAVIRGHSAQVSSVSFSPNSDLLASVGWDQRMVVRVWDFHSGEDRLVLRGHAREVHAVAWTRCGGFLVSGSEDKSIRVWSSKGGEVHAILRGHEKGINSLCFNHNGKILVSGSSDRAVKVWVVDKDRQVVEEEEAHAGRVYKIAFNPQDPTVVASCSADKTIQVWNFETGAATSAGLGGHTDYVLDVAFSPHDPNLLASCSSDTTIRLWDVQKFRVILPPLTGHSGAVCCLLFHPSDPAVLASGSSDRTIRVWSVTGGHLRRTLRGHDSGVASLACSLSNPNLLASGGQDGRIKLWHFLEGSPAGVDLVGHEGSVNHLRFTEAASRLISCCQGGRVSLWDVSSFSCLLRWDSKAQLTWTSEKFVLACEQGNIMVYNLPSGPEASWSPRAFFKSPNAIVAIACSGDQVCVADESRKLLRMRLTRDGSRRRLL